MPQGPTRLSLSFVTPSSLKAIILCYHAPLGRRRARSAAFAHPGPRPPRAHPARRPVARWPIGWCVGRVELSDPLSGRPKSRAPRGERRHSAARDRIGPVDGSPWPLELPAPDASIIELLPLHEPAAIEGEIRFILDVHLGKLARMLRLLGIDAVRFECDDSYEIIRNALAEERIILTRNRALLFRRELRRGSRSAMLILSPDPYAQLIEASRRFGLDGRFAPLSRCAACGSPIRPASREEARPLIPAIVAERYEEFFLCPRCGKAYWKGDHFRNIRPFLARLSTDLGAGRASGPPPPR
ncbi:MAG: Mut7-C RNAse domain-containing protein [Vulcanimicrobiaceae bacterium]